MLTPLSEEEKKGIQRIQWFRTRGASYLATTTRCVLLTRKPGIAYNLLQSTTPQTLAYLLADSPAGLLAWIYERLVLWADNYPWTDDESKWIILPSVSLASY